MKKNNIVFCSFPDYSGNARALYEYMKKRYQGKMNFTWVVNDILVKQKLEEKKVNVVLNGSNEMNNEIKKTDVFFTTHADLVDYKCQNSKTLYIELWHGVSPKCMGHLIKDISESDKDWCNKIAKKIDYYIVPSKFWTPIFSARFHAYPNRCLPLGFPLFDSIVYSDSKKNLEKVLNCDLSKYSKIIYYMPTFRSGKSRDEKVEINTYNIFNIKKYDEDKLIEYLEKNNYLLCVKRHPSEKTEFKKINSNNIKYIEESELKRCEFDIYQVLNASDILVSDYSSLGLLYLILEKPVIYLTHDISDYNDTRGILFGNFKFWTGNNTANNITDLMNKIEENLIDKELLSVKEKKELLFGNLKDGGCKNICDYFFTTEGKIKSSIEYIEIEEEKLKLENQNLKEELSTIKNSKGYKFLEKLRNFKSKVRK